LTLKKLSVDRKVNFVAKVVATGCGALRESSYKFYYFLSTFIKRIKNAAGV